MKKAIIIGSNKGYGTAISKALHNNGFYTIGLSRKIPKELPMKPYQLLMFQTMLYFQVSLKRFLKKITILTQ